VLFEQRREALVDAQPEDLRTEEKLLSILGQRESNAALAWVTLLAEHLWHGTFGHTPNHVEVWVTAGDSSLADDMIWTTDGYRAFNSS